MKRLFNTIALLLTFLIVFNSVACKEGSNIDIDSDIGFYYANSLQTVKQDADATNYEQLGVIGLSCAKGETEGTQFFVNSNKDIKGYDLSVSDLQLDANNKIKAENINIYVQIYTEATSSALFVGTYGAGIYPDCLIPINYIKNAKENNITANNNQGFWIDVKIPNGVKKGVYNGTITFSVGKSKKDIPISVNVYDFEMPECPALATCYLIWNDWLLDTEFDNTTDKYWDYYNTLLEYNISGYVFPSDSTQDFVIALKKYYDKVNMFGIPYRAINKNTNDWDYYKAYMLAIGEQCGKDGKNYFDKAYYYFDMFYDEATSFDWRIEQLKSIVETTNIKEEEIILELVQKGAIESTTCEIANSIRNLKHSITTEKYMHNSTWEDLLYMYVQHSKGMTTTADIEKYKELLGDSDYTIWGYTTELCDYPNPAVNIPDIPVSARDIYWFDYQMGISGELYWCTNCNLNCLSVSGLRYSPIYDPYHSAMHDSVSNGGGYYLYPGVHYGSDKPFPSIRLAVKRDGIDDYTYIKELENKYRSAGCASNVREIVSFMNEVLIKSGRSKINEQGVFTARDNIAKLIEAFNLYGLVIENIEYTDTNINLKLRADSGVIIKINGQNYVSGTNLVLSEIDGIVISCEKGNDKTDIRFDTKNLAELENGFEIQDKQEILKVQTNYNNSCEINNTVTRSGEYSGKVQLKGYVDFSSAQKIVSYKPAVYINLKDLNLNNGLDGCTEISFYVYNESVAREYEVYAIGLTQDYVYDKVVLKKNEWTKITIDNFNIISLDKNDYKDILAIGIRTDNLYLKTGNTYSVNNDLSQTLYFDDIYVGRK